jgi:hypothetical protein
MMRYVTHGDIALIVILTLLSLTSFGALRYIGASGDHAVVAVDGQRVLELPLNRDTQSAVRGPLGDTVIAIENGEVWVKSSPCPRGHCMHMGKIRHSGEILICVPNRVFVSIRSNLGRKQTFDGVSE